MTALAFAGTVAVAFGALSTAEGQQPGGISGEGVARWLQNKSYERLEYGSKGDLEIHQTIRFGTMAPRETGCEIPVHVISFSVIHQPHVKKTKEFSLIVDCASPHLVASVMMFIRESGDQRLVARVAGDEPVYPEQPQDGMVLPELHYPLRYRRGLLAALGTRVTIDVTDRRVSTLSPASLEDSCQPAYEIFSEISARMRIIGVSMGTTRFSSRLVMDPIHGLVEEDLEHADGGRTLIRLMSNPELSNPRDTHD